MTRSLLLFIVFICSLTQLSYAQAPGGVRTSTELELWLKVNDGTREADASTPENGEVVTDWLDQSGNGNDGDNSTSGADPVEYLENAFGFYPAIEFNNDDRAIRGQLSKGSDNYTLYIVASDSSSDNSDKAFFEIAGGGDRHWLIENRYAASSNFTTNTYLPKDSLIIIAVDHPTGTSSDIYVNGQSFESGVTSTASSSGTAGGTYNFTVGDDDTGGNEFVGTIAEVIVYDATLTAGERQRIESYLALKYGITMTQDYILSDGSTTIFEIASNPTFNQGIIAIGQDDDSELDQKVAKSKLDSLIIATDADFTSPNDDGTRTTSLANDAFFVVSHHGGSLGLDSASGGIADTRLGRVWKVNETNTPGAVNVAIPSSLGTFSNMLVNSIDATFAGSNTEVSLTLSGGYYTASYDFADGDFFSFVVDPVYPGAVAADIELWLKADGGVTAPGNLVSLWADQSGNAQNATGASNAELQDNQTNFYPGIVFDNDAQPFSGSITTDNAEYTVFTVYRDNAAGDSEQALWDFDGSQSRILDDNNFAGGGVFANNVTKGATSLLTIAHDNSTTAIINIDGASFESSYTTVGPSLAGAYSYYLGDDNDGSNRFSGAINEVILYDRSFVGNEVQRIESYLAIKYGIALGINYLDSDGTTIFDLTANAGYLNSIIALGQDNASALTQNVARASNGTLTISTSSDFTTSNPSRGIALNDKDFFFVSHDGGELTTTLRSGERQLSRVWRASEVTDIGAVFLAVDEGIANITNLVVNSADPTFSAGNVDVPVTFVDGRYTVSYDLDNGDYFTFSTAQVPGNVANGLGVWLKANEGAQNAGSQAVNGQAVTTWIDQSGNSNDGDDSDPNADPVEFVDNVYNFQPAISFNDDDKPIVGTLDKTTGDLTMFVVATDVSADGSQNCLVEVSIGTSTDRRYLIENRYAGVTNYGGAFLPKDSSFIGAVVHPLGTTTADIFINGETFVADISTSGGTNSNGTYNLTIGDDVTGGNEFEGTIAEVIVYDSELTIAERQRVESYLAIKYGITQQADYLTADGTVIFDLSANANFNQGISFLGTDVDSDLEQKVGRADGDSLIISTESDFSSSNDDVARSVTLADEAFFGVSHHGGSYGLDSAYEGTAELRLGRAWTVHETGSTGSIHVGIPTSLGQFTNLVINSADPTFAAGNTEVALSISGGYYTASYDFADGDYFTFSSVELAPGGVLADLELWLKADEGVTAPGSLVSGWSDQSPTAQDATGTSAAELVTSETNFNPGIAFQGDASAIDGSITTTNTEYAVFTVYQDTSAVDSDRVLWDLNGTQGRVLDDNNFAGGSAFSSNITKNATSLLTMVHDNGTSADLTINGGAFETSYTTSPATTAGAYTYDLGSDNAGMNPFSGTINEVIYYDGSFGGNEVNRIESYLAIKYGLTLSHDYLDSDGSTAFDLTANSGFTNDIIAVGTDIASALNQNVSTSVTDSVVIATTNDFTSSNSGRGQVLGDREFFFVSNDGADFSTVLRSSSQQLNRVWKVNEVGSVGTMYVAISENVGPLVNLVIASDAGISSIVSQIALTRENGFYTANYDFTSGQFFTFSQGAAPGAVASNLELWLKADDGVSDAAGVVTTWADRSGNGDDLTNSGGNTLFRNEALLNFNPLVEFNEDDRPITGTMTTSGTDYSFFAVVVDSTVEESDAGYFEIENGDRYFVIENRYASGTDYSFDTYNKNEPQFIAIDHPAGTSVDIYLNGSQAQAGYTTTTADGASGEFEVVLGDDDTGGNEFSGALAELIIYDQTLTSTQRDQVHSYMAIKYGIVMDIDYIEPSAAGVVYDQSANTGYTSSLLALAFDQLAGLDQQISASSLDSILVATSDDFIAINTSRVNSLGEGQYFFASSNGADYDLNTGGTIVAGTPINRIWRVSETNNPGSIFVGIPSTVNGQISNIIVSSDPTFNTGVTSTELQLSGGYLVAAVDFADGDFFTFADVPTPGGISDGLELWLRADLGVVETSNAVTSWIDVAGRGNDASNGGTSPTLRDNTINFNPSIDFEAAGTDLSGSLTTATDSITVLVVAIDSSADNSGNVLFEFRNQAIPANTLTFTDEAYANGVGTFTNAIQKDTAQLLTVDHSNGATVADIYVNGQLFEDDYTTVTPTEMATYDYALGETNAGINGLNGAIAEVVVYSETLTLIQRQQVESYLSIKYGIAATSDLYNASSTQIFDATANVGYTTDLIALGRDDATDLDQNISRSVRDSVIVSTTNDFATANTSRSSQLLDNQYFIMTNNGSDFTLTEDYRGLTNSRLSRVWKVNESNSPDAVHLAIPNSGGDFTGLNTMLVSTDPTFSTGVSEVTLTSSGDYNIVSFDFTDTQYFTFSTVNVENRIWYSLQSGDWTDATVWTLDGSLSPIYVNPLNEIPSEGDTAVVNTGRVVTANVNSISLGRIVIDGTLNIGTTGNQDFSFIEGIGNLIMSGSADNTDNYPSGVDSLFANAELGGTVTINGDDITLDSIRDFNNLILDLDASSNRAFFASDTIQINGDFTVTEGNFQFNVDDDSDSLVVTVNGDLLVEEDGGFSLGVSTLPARHELNLYGDFLHFGNSVFTHRTTSITNFEATDGMVDVNFLSGEKDQILDLKTGSTANFYRIEINKGVDDTYKLTIVADEPSNFNLFGFAEENHNSTRNQAPNQDDQLFENDNRLGLLFGTVELGNNIDIILTGGNNVPYQISVGAKLLVNGATVTASAHSIYGSHVLEAGSTSVTGITVLRDAGAYEINGGSASFGHFRTSAFGTDNVGSFTQTAGTFTVTGEANTGGSGWYQFSLGVPQAAFNMSGGVLQVTGTDGNDQGLFINVNAENVNVTGGEIILDVGSDDSLKFVSNVPLYDLTIRQSTAGSGIVVNKGGVSGFESVALQNSSLTVLNDLVIEDTGNGTDFNGNQQQIFLTGRLEIQSGSTFELDSASLTFENEGSSQIAIENGSTLVLDTLILDKDISTQVVEIVSGTTVAMQIDSLLSIQSGILDYMGFNVSVKKDMIVNSQIGLAGSNGTIILDGTLEQTVTTDSSHVVHDIEINNSAGVSLAGDLTVDTLDLDFGIFDINQRRLVISGALQTSSAFSNTLMVQTSGNDSDGGLAMFFDADETMSFPVGTNANAISRYTPVDVTLDASSDAGYVIINPVDEELGLLNQLVSDEALTYYWRSRNIDFTDPSTRTVNYVFNYVNMTDDVPVADDPETEYIPGWVDSDFTRVKNPTSIGVPGDNITASAISTDAHSLITAKYTAGDETKFDGTIEIYYNRSSAGVWNNANSWSSVSHTSTVNTFGTFPQEGDVVNLANGDEGGDNSHYITVPSGTTVDAAEVIFDNDHDDDGTTGWGPRLIFQVNSSVGNLGTVSGVGGQLGIQLSSNAANNPTVNGDFGSFNGNGETDFSSINNQFIFFPQNNNATHLVPSNLTEFPNIRVHGPGGTTRRTVVFPEDITVARDVRIDVSVIVELDNDDSGDITIGRNLQLGPDSNGGELVFQNNGTARTVTVGEDLRIRGSSGGSGNSAVEVETGGSASLLHRLVVGQDILIQNNDRTTLDLFTDNSGGSNVILELNSEVDASLTSVNTNSIDLYQIVVNKGMDTTSVFTVTGAVSVDSLTLQNGKLILDNSSINFDLSTDQEFEIPETAGLELTQGTYTLTGDGMRLSGLLRVNGASLDLDNAYIEYSNSGAAFLNVESGNLEVGQGIRRPVETAVAPLIYRQTGGTVLVAADGSATNQRGTFEVLNPGSEFTLTGGDFTIRRGTNSNSVPSLRLDPEVYDVTGSTVTIGDGSTNSPSTPFGIRSTIPFNNLTIDDSSNDLPTVQLISNDLIVENNFIINNGAVFNSNDFNVTIRGDLVNGTGSTYTNNSANTILEGTSTLSGDGTFTIHDLTKIGDNTTSTVEVDITVGNDLFVTNGTLALGSNDLDLKRDATIQDTVAVSGTSGGIVFSGLGDQNLFGKTNASIPVGALTINNGAEVEIDQGNGYNFTITDTLRMEGGVFDIGGSLLTIAQNAGIKEVSTFSATNSIQTNSSFTDNGVLKIFNGTEDDFFFPVGETKYTPVSISINSNSLLSGDSILIRPANEFHPAILSDDETMEAGMPTGDPALNDTTNVLNYYWIVLANNVTDFTGAMTFNFLGEDAGIDNDFDDNGFDETSYDTTYYAPARLIKSSLLWDKAYGTNDYDGAGEQMTFTFSSAQTDEQLSGDYTAGIYRDPTNSDSEIKGSIPDAVPTYIFTPIGGELGDYTVAANWTPVGTSPVPTDGVGPVGALITINAGDTLDLNRTGIRLLTTEISSGAVLRVNGNVINRLGGIEGTGTIILEDAGDLPAGFYNDFFTCDGGALVYDGTTDYSVLGGIPQIRRVDFNGSGTRFFPNNSLQVCDTLSVNGPIISFNQGNSLDIEDRFELNSGVFGITNGSDMLVRGDFAVSGGSFTGNSTADIELRDSIIYRGGTLDFNQTPVSLTGSTTQYIEGGVTFQRLIVNNTGGGIDIRDDGDNDVIITTAITFTDGLVRTGDGDTLVLNANATYSDVSNASFVRGPVKKLSITAGSNYTFPVGDVDASKAPNGVYSPVRIVGVGNGGQDWYGQFFFGSQQDNTLFDATDPGSGQNSLKGIFDLSWKVASTGANTSKVELYYQTNYGTYADNNDLRVALWDVPDQEYKNQGGIVTGSNTNGVVVSENTIHFSENDLALGSAPEDTTPLPVEMLYFNGVDNNGAVDLSWATATEIDNEYFEIHRSQDGRDWEIIGVVAGAGSTVEEQVYAFSDFKPYVGDSYYRLRQVDFDGQFEYSEIILVRVALESISFNVYPNPVDDQFTVDIKGINANELVPYQIVSLQGRYVSQGELQGDEAGRINQQVMLGLNQPAGIYVLRIQTSQRVFRFNLIKR